MNVNDFDFDLPEELIAQTPLKDRTASRLWFLIKKPVQSNIDNFSSFIDELEQGISLF